MVWKNVEEKKADLHFPAAWRTRASQAVTTVCFFLLLDAGIDGVVVSASSSLGGRGGGGEEVGRAGMYGEYDPEDQSEETEDVVEEVER